MKTMIYHCTPIRTPNSSKKQDHSYPPHGNKNGAITLETNLAGSYKTKCATTKQFNNCTPEFKWQLKFTHKVVHKCSVPMSSICNSPQMETTKISTDEWLTKPNLEPSY